MKAHQLATLVLRLLGIYCLLMVFPFTALSSFYFLGISQDMPGGTAATVVAMMFLIGWIILSISLIIFSSALGKKLTPEESSIEKISNLSFEQVQVLAFAAVGVFILAEALPQLLNSIPTLFISIHRMTENGAGSRSILYQLLSASGIIFKAALGLWLLFGARGFAGMLNSFRNLGTPKAPQPENGGESQ